MRRIIIRRSILKAYNKIFRIEPQAMTHQWILWVLFPVRMYVSKKAFLRYLPESNSFVIYDTTFSDEFFMYISSLKDGVENGIVFSIWKNDGIVKVQIRGE